MCKMYIKENDYTIIDESLYSEVSKFKWYRDPIGYVARSKKIINEKRNTKVYLHRFILELSGFDISTKCVDHINRIKNDNRLENLRLVTHKINMRNINSKLNSTSKILGVHYNKINKNWRAQIRVNGKTIDLGSYKTEQEAENARLKFVELNPELGFRR